MFLRAMEEMISEFYSLHFLAQKGCACPLAPPYYSCLSVDLLWVYQKIPGSTLARWMWIPPSEPRPNFTGCLEATTQTNLPQAWFVSFTKITVYIYVGQFLDVYILTNDLSIYPLKTLTCFDFPSLHIEYE